MSFSFYIFVEFHILLVSYALSSYGKVLIKTFMHIGGACISICIHVIMQLHIYSENYVDIARTLIVFAHTKTIRDSVYHMYLRFSVNN